MAGKRQRPNGTWEFKFQRKGVLPTPVHFTFDSLEEGLEYEKRAEELLDRGVVPPEMGEAKMSTLEHLFDAYEMSGMSTKSDAEMFATMTNLVGGVELKLVSYDWVEGLVTRLATDRGLSPSSIKKRIEFLGRAIAWGMRKEKLSLVNNPVKLLPKGYATKEVPKEALWAGQRDRRLHVEGSTTEEGAIRKVLVKKEEHLLFDMALESAMRMSEMVTLKKDQVDLARRTIFLNRTKNGSKRQVPISSVLSRLLEEHLATVEDRDEVFSFWKDPLPDNPNPSGEDLELFKESVKAATNRVSHLFGSRFKKAGCVDLRFHDLRHEATARLYERTTMTDLEIASITGHTDMRMLQRYANLRGSTLASKMW